MMVGNYISFALLSRCSCRQILAGIYRTSLVNLMIALEECCYKWMEPHACNKKIMNRRNKWKEETNVNGTSKTSSKTGFCLLIRVIFNLDQPECGPVDLELSLISLHMVPVFNIQRGHQSLYRTKIRQIEGDSGLERQQKNSKLRLFLTCR